MRQQNLKLIEESVKILGELKDMRGGSTLPFHRQIANDPALANAFLQGYKICNKQDTQIPPKYRELMLMMLGCAQRVPTTIKTHAKLAQEHGATIAEIGEALRLVLFYCGASCVIPAAEIFEELDYE